MKLSQIVSKLEEKGLHKTAENVKRVVEGQDSPESVVKELLYELVDGDFSELVTEIEIALDEAGLEDTRVDKQFHRADRALNLAEKEFGKLLKMLK